MPAPRSAATSPSASAPSKTPLARLRTVIDRPRRRGGPKGVGVAGWWTATSSRTSRPVKKPSERTVSLPACLRQARLPAVCCRAETDHLQGGPTLLPRSRNGAGACFGVTSSPRAQSRSCPCGQRQSRAGATVVRMLSMTCVLYSTPSWFGTVSRSVSAAAIASSWASCATSTSGSAA